MGNSHYFIGKEDRANKANRHKENMSEFMRSATLEAIEETKIYWPGDADKKEILAGKYDTVIDTVPMTTVEAINKYGGNSKIAALNFASYKEPGGMFLNGSSAQEESLCHESNLYNILEAFKVRYYEWNIRHKNKALYFNRALYTPNVRFTGSLSDCNDNEASIRVNYYRLCDIITCAAPNYTAARRYCNVSNDENKKACIDRINFVLSIAAQNNVETLILGAFGCGVFGQDARLIALIFKELLQNKFNGVFKEIIFAIPESKNDNNFLIFKNILL